jgi:hypothetical protein
VLADADHIGALVLSNFVVDDVFIADSSVPCAAIKDEAVVVLINEVHNPAVIRVPSGVGRRHDPVRDSDVFREEVVITVRARISRLAQAAPEFLGSIRPRVRAATRALKPWTDAFEFARLSLCRLSGLPGDSTDNPVDLSGDRAFEDEILSVAKRLSRAGAMEPKRPDGPREGDFDVFSRDEREIDRLGNLLFLKLDRTDDAALVYGHPTLDFERCDFSRRVLKTGFVDVPGWVHIDVTEDNREQSY